MLAIELEIVLELVLVLELSLVPKGINTGTMSNGNVKLWAISHACTFSSSCY